MALSSQTGEQSAPTAPSILEAYSLAEGQVDAFKLRNCMRDYSKD